MLLFTTVIFFFRLPGGRWINFVCTDIYVHNCNKISKTTHTHIFYMNCKESDSNDGSSFGKIDTHIIHTTYLPRKRVFAEEVEYLHLYMWLLFVTEGIQKFSRLENKMHVSFVATCNFVQIVIMICMHDICTYIH